MSVVALSQMRRRRRPGVTAAATTAVFAIGDGPGETAFATTAVFATGWPMTPTRPTRPARMTVSLSFGRVVGLDRGDDRLDRDPSVRDELTARPPGGGGEWRGPQVLPDQDSGRAARIHGRGEIHDVVGCQQLSELRLEGLEHSKLGDVRELDRFDRTVLVLAEDQDVDQADGPGVDQGNELTGHLSGEAALARRKLDHGVVDRSELVERRLGHRSSPSMPLCCGRRPHRGNAGFTKSSRRAATFCSPVRHLTRVSRDREDLQTQVEELSQDALQFRLVAEGPADPGVAGLVAESQAGEDTLELLTQLSRDDDGAMQTGHASSLADTAPAATTFHTDHPGDPQTGGTAGCETSSCAKRSRAS